LVLSEDFLYNWHGENDTHEIYGNRKKKFDFLSPRVAHRTLFSYKSDISSVLFSF